MDKIKKIEVEEIFDSRGDPTINVIVFTEASSGSFAVPSGASTGKFEAHELRDGGEEDKGKGVRKAMEKIKQIIEPVLIGKEISQQKEIDQILLDLDGTTNKDNLGGNTMIGVSLACAKAAAQSCNKEVFEYLRTLIDIKPSRQIPLLFINLINGGKHSVIGPVFQEYHIVPQTENLEEALGMAFLIQKTLKEIFNREFPGQEIKEGDEGGLIIPHNSIRKPLEFLREALGQNNLEERVRLSLDVAASSFFNDGFYEVEGKKINSEELKNIYQDLIKEFNLFSIEDPFEENDFKSFRDLKNTHEGIKIVGDDLTVTNQERLKEAIKNDSLNALIIKPNQVGTLTETLETMKLARENNIECLVSHRSGETLDDFIADLVYAFGCFGLKTGAPHREERKIKYDRLLKISKI